MQAKELTIKNPEGLRASRAAMFVQVAGGFTSQIFVEKGNKKINAKSIMGVLSLGAGRGDAIRVFISGVDEKEAAAAIMELIEEKKA